jgi:DNA-binding CsgD family transcriptional regulator
MERLTKKELRSLLESIKECYPVCDRQTFKQRVLSRLAKIVPTEIISHVGTRPHRRRSAHATHPRHAYTSSGREFSNQRALASSYDSSSRDARRSRKAVQSARRIQLKSLSRKILDSHSQSSPKTPRQAGLNRNDDLADHEQPCVSLLSPHNIQAYRSAKTVAQRRQNSTLVDDALNTLNLGLILLTPHGKIRLATGCAVQQVRAFLGDNSLIGDSLPESLWMWVKQQEPGLNESSDDPLLRSRLILEREGKRLVIRLVSDSHRILLLREEHLTHIKTPQPPDPCNLSSREAQVLQWVSQGKTNKEIGVILELSARTVQKHLEHIYQKLGVESRTGAAAKAYEIASTAAK